MSSLKIDKIIDIIKILDQMSQDLKIGRLSGVDKDVLTNLYSHYDRNNNKINIKNLEFIDFEGNVISKSTLYKSLKSLCEKKIISHLGSSRSCIYKFN
mgnify:FL=1